MMNREQYIAFLRSKVSAGAWSVRRELALALKSQGDAWTQLGEPENLAKAVDLCEEAIALLSDQPAAENESDRDELASAWMKRGIALLNMGNADALREAIRCFEKAIGLRQALARAENPNFRYGLAAGWMNRGDALTRLGSPGDLAEAVRSYDEALPHLLSLSGGNPLFQKRLAIAWMNRGITLQEQGTPGSLALAVESFDRTITLLNDPAAIKGPEFTPIPASAWMNRGNALLRQIPPEAGPGRDAAREALGLVAGIEEQDLIAAEAGFKARHILCRAIGNLLAESPAGNIVPMDLHAEATDAVEDGMRLARHWESRGVARFRPLANDLFRFGAKAYQIHQPHFLVEFLLESLDSGETADSLSDYEEKYASARESLWGVVREIQREGFKSLNTPRFDQLLEMLRALHGTDGRLTELRRQYLDAVDGTVDAATDTAAINPR